MGMSWDIRNHFSDRGRGEESEILIAQCQVSSSLLYISIYPNVPVHSRCPAHVHVRVCDLVIVRFSVRVHARKHGHRQNLLYEYEKDHGHVERK